MNEPIQDDAEEFPYQFGDPKGIFSFSDLDLVLQWCKENVRGRWGYRRWSLLPFAFENKFDASLFKIFWNPTPTAGFDKNNQFYIISEFW